MHNAPKPRLNWPTEEVKRCLCDAEERVADPKKEGLAMHIDWVSVADVRVSEATERVADPKKKGSPTHTNWVEVGDVAVAEAEESIGACSL